ncbi:hypothetical protein FACS189449_11970 [Alphaproteobacteria bacterium]|nr:hypothetical protein FACS189449_11970 [Alphaproteobacteria bacterium]
MNKTLIACSSFVIAMFFSADASLDVADWYTFLYGDKKDGNGASKPEPQLTYFDESTDLIKGQVLISSGLVKNHRFFGPVKYDRFYEKGNPANYSDTSSDPMTSLVIKLFPSTGVELNAIGKGSISEILEGIKANEIEFIATMFAVADFVREELTSPDKRKELVQKAKDTYEKHAKSPKMEELKAYYLKDGELQLTQGGKQLTPEEFLKDYADKYFTYHPQEAEELLERDRVSIKTLNSHFSEITTA